ncbi:hypothetical protein IWQ47_000205 [Aquimarina sp. EL_43]|uniref:hypothetical protein n=1 Tax=unclassified Aquimarina TaxID=2627091 RepID=UPI0018CB36EF|nr:MULTISPECIES: hypothetical protein [unclassified Aquimarina]MBG6129103.1 hypothetical protein [Aquimarina sp. EL_35]MBG6150168.1 hypothetical protein [Aquimarina sp. EL_32]MBG6167147.1 hypothetical protein [Aquimarina sp. EL_43]
MNNNYIEFKKKRELGDILTDTFAFIRQNGKSLLSVLLKTSGISFILLLLASAYYTHSSANLFDPVSIRNGGMYNSGTLIIALFAMLATLLVFYALLFGTVLHYIKNYIDNKGNVDLEVILHGVKKDFGNIIGLGILSGLITFFGFMLCAIPGIYLYVPMSLVFSILVFRGTSISDAINDSFLLVKNEWWITFATLFIIAILIGVIGFVFSIPALIYTFTKTFTAASEGSLADPSTMFDWVFIALNTLSSAAQYILYIITAISTAFIYYNLNERKHATGALEQIDSLGKSE